MAVVWASLSVLIAVHARPTTGFTDPPAAFLDNEPLVPLPPAPAIDPDKMRLGEKLFHDVRLSRGGTLACASCHRLDQGGDDGNHVRSPSSREGEVLDFNTPTVFNAALNFRLNWRGNFRTFEEQNETVLLDPRLMNTTWEELLPKLRADPDYNAAFAAIYGDGPEPAHVLDALATFQRSLLTPDAPFDRYLRGQRGAITKAEEQGYRLFKGYGCTACHQGVNVGGNLFQRFGIFNNPFPQAYPMTKADLGRFAITGQEVDRHVFRVPSLRNVDVTAPYLHDGRAPTLERAVEIMARTQLGKALTEQEISLIVGFLHTLTGVYRGRSLNPDADRAP
jgi:cytochrome c peroxidase